MGEATLSLNFSETAAALTDALILEQSPIGVNQVTRLDLVKGIAAQLYGGLRPAIDCGITNGKFGVEIQVYPYDPALVYTIQLSHGKLSNRQVGLVTVIEAVQFLLSDSETTKYPIQQMDTFILQETCWDSAGGVVTAPTVTFDGVNLHLSKKIYGNVWVTYQTIRHSYRSYIPAYADDLGGPYQSVCIANWHGGVKLLVLDTPKSKLASDDGCAWVLHDRWIVTIPDEKLRPPTVDGVFNTVEIDYCTQKKQNG